MIGRAGCGKTYLMNCVNKYLCEKLEAPGIMRLAAPTGTAAFQVGGETLHSLLQLPVPAPKKDPAPKLSRDQLKRLQDDLEKCEMLVIDEVSMLSPLRLYQIDQRLRQAKPKKANKLFGGVSIVLMGDFAQLPPVCDKALFEVLLLSFFILEKRKQFLFYSKLW